MNTVHCLDKVTRCEYYTTNQEKLNPHHKTSYVVTKMYEPTHTGYPDQIHNRSSSHDSGG